MKTKEIEVDGKKITIWKMNFGFRSDYQGDTTSTRVEMVNGKRERKVEVDNGKMILMTLVYGIYESNDLGIPAPSSIELGFNPSEKENRLKKIRSLDLDVDKIFDAINEINTEVEEEVLKK
jgi:hypothetical protein